MTPSTREVKPLTGNYKVPLLVLASGTIIDGSENIIEWAPTNEAAGLSEYPLGTRSPSICLNTR